jgi:DNA repair protein RadC
VRGLRETNAGKPQNGALGSTQRLVEPSPEDVQVTLRLRDAGRLLNIELLDHIILGKEDAFSFAEHGLI